MKIESTPPPYNAIAPMKVSIPAANMACPHAMTPARLAAEIPACEPAPKVFRGS